MKKTLRLLALLFLIVSGCSNESPEKISSNKPEKITFNIDISQLADSVINSDLNVKFNPPRNWNLVSEEIFEHIKKQVKSEFDDSLKIEPIYMFMNDSIKSFLSVSILKFGNPEYPFKEKTKLYNSFLFRRFDPKEIHIAEFIKDDIHITQFLIQKDEFVNFKLLLSNAAGEIIQFDYLVVREFYPNEIKAIESSIGSIQTINKL